MRFTRILTFMAVALLALDGCGSRGMVQDGDGSGQQASGAYRGGRPRAGADRDASMTGYATAGGTGLGSTDGGVTMPTERVIYFQFDSDEVLPQYLPVVSANATYLAAHPEREALIQGHADERGSPEYNIALGERRAKAVQRLLQLQGAGDGQLQVVSFGEEMPADPGHDEGAWNRNRRVAISYSGQ